ncbi:hypothetical protein L228DRAFT_250275 [Xylona heveae TC161]|uniref:PD-(D/E)XK nuclease-like domain-containing protein n=1 Tax=Xylona heveae (strain CBS 132557 / TC161) TaxID=1328760 RepID=A0A165A264_XYLHT|nr:hypothetical protein L228DRAFT_250275 [Xylona heveae TC161]KZF19849.1 hypothetical protein L228DRAFT_250275 [Xylona heveae TC161]
MPTMPLPDAVKSLLKHLQDGFGLYVIPYGLKTKLHDPQSILTEIIPESAYFDSSEMSDHTINTLWSELERVRLDAIDCESYAKDENAWCLDVVQPILSSDKHENSKLNLISVQSQQIDQSLLPVTRDGVKHINKKTDYAFFFSPRDPEVSGLYQKLSIGGRGMQISHTTDAFSKRVTLFSGIEVKAADGRKYEALAQLAKWLAASLEMNRKLGILAQGENADQPGWLLPTVGHVVVGHDWLTYLCYKAENVVRVLGPIDALSANSRSIYGIIKLRDLHRRVNRYATDVYWPWVRDEILRPLASKA